MPSSLAVEDGAAHQAADDVVAAFVLGRHAVGDAEDRRARVVGDAPHAAAVVGVLAVLPCRRACATVLDDGEEQINFVVVGLAAA